MVLVIAKSKNKARFQMELKLNGIELNVNKNAYSAMKELFDYFLLEQALYLSKGICISKLPYWKAITLSPSKVPSLYE